MRVCIYIYTQPQKTENGSFSIHFSPCFPQLVSPPQPPTGLNIFSTFTFLYYTEIEDKLDMSETVFKILF